MKAQITLYVIMGMVVLLVLAFGLYFLTDVRLPGVGGNIGAYEEHLQACLKLSTENIIERIILQGGILNPSGDEIYYKGRAVQVTYDEGSLQPNREQLAAAISEEIVNLMDLCVNTSQFEEQGLEFTQEKKAEARTIIRDQTMQIIYKEGYAITKQETMYEPRTIETKINTNLGKTLDLIKKIHEGIFLADITPIGNDQRLLCDQLSMMPQYNLDFIYMQIDEPVDLTLMETYTLWSYAGMKTKEGDPLRFAARHIEQAILC